MLGVVGNNPRDLDQFFTTKATAKSCVDFINSHLNNPTFDIVVEPSFGDGAFVNAAENIKKSTLIYVDIDAKDIESRKNFLTDEIIPKNMFHGSKERNKSCLVLGNPPFGKNSSLAIKFFNHSATFADVIAFIVPKTFLKISVQNKLCRDFFQTGLMDIDQDSFIFENSPYNVPCVFQIWVRHSYLPVCNFSPEFKIPVNNKRKLHPILNTTDHFYFVKASQDPDFAIRRVGVNAGRIFTDDLKGRSSQSHMFLKVTDKSSPRNVENLLLGLDLENASCKYYTAGCPSISKSELCEIYTKNTISIKIGSKD